MQSSEKQSEQILVNAKISVAALVALWVSVPAFLLVGFCATYLPRLIGAYAHDKVMQALLDGLGVEASSFGEIFSAVGKNAFSAIPTGVKAFLIVMTVLLIVCWVVWALVCTKLHFRYSLAVTDSRVSGTAKGNSLDVPLEELVNVFVGQSWMGKLFRYGSVTVQTKRGSLTVNNVSRPNEIKKLLMKYVE